MVKRRKRLEKGIASIERQITLHKEKKGIASEEGKVELVEYYEKEILSKERAKGKKEEMLRKEKRIRSNLFKC